MSFLFLATLILLAYLAYRDRQVVRHYEFKIKLLFATLVVLILVSLTCWGLMFFLPFEVVAADRMPRWSFQFDARGAGSVAARIAFVTGLISFVLLIQFRSMTRLHRGSRSNARDDKSG